MEPNDIVEKTGDLCEEANHFKNPQECLLPQYWWFVMIFFVTYLISQGQTSILCKYQYKFC